MNSKDWHVQVFYDGDCPLCVREIGLIRRFDRKNRILFTDIAGEDFKAKDWDKSYDELMAEIHGRLPSGEWITGVEVFRQLYTAIGLRWVAALTRLPLISHILDFGYRVFARNRLRLTGRCQDGVCQLPKPQSEDQAKAA